MARTTTHITNKERSKIYKAKKKVKTTANIYTIPKGQTRKAIDERQKLITKYLNKLESVVYCPALEADVMVIRKGIKETRVQASLSYRSTIAALTLKEAIENATYIKELPVKRSSNNQKCFRKMHLLICPIQYIGYAKIMVGEFYEIENIPTKYSHYCITQISLQKLKK